MNVDEFVSLVFAHNKARKEAQKQYRLSQHDLQLLAYLYECDGVQSMNELVEFMHVLVPTLAVRTRRLASRGLLTKKQCKLDRRKVTIQLTPKGERYLERAINSIEANLVAPMPLSKCDTERLLKYYAAMASCEFDAKDIILLVLYLHPSAMITNTKLVELTSYLQPTVSITSKQLCEQGLMQKEKKVTQDTREVRLVLTSKGVSEAKKISERVQAIKVKRPRRIVLC